MSLFRTKRIALALALCSSVAAAMADDGAGTAPLVYRDAHIFTADAAQPYAEAIAVRQGRILAVGNTPTVLAAAGSTAQVIDLHGAYLLPGLIDAHAHPIGTKLVLGGGLTRVMPSYESTSVDVDALVGFVTRVLERGEGRIGNVLLVQNVDIGHWAHAREIDARLSAGVFAEQAVVLVGNDGHTAWVNAAERRAAGISASSIAALAPAERRFYEVDAHGEPTGFVVDAGLTRVRASLPPFAPALSLAAGRAGVGYMNSLGITAWLDAAAAGVVGGDLPLRDDDPGAFETYRLLAAQGELSAHVAAYPVVDPQLGVAQIDVAQALQRRYRDVANLRIPGIKIFADGVVEYPSQTASLSRPYLNSGREVAPLVDPERFAQLLTEADHRGMTVHIHAIGDRAVKASLDAIAAARRANPGSHIPHTITHAQFVDPADFPRFRELGVPLALQLLWALADPSTIDVVKPYVDPEIYRHMYPARSLLEAGALIAGASDWPVSSANPFEAMAQAESRAGPQGVLDATQRMPRLAMLEAYTRNAAIVLGMADEIGSLSPGKYADMVCVDRDPLTASTQDLRDTKVLWTQFEGRTVYRAAPAQTP